MSDTTRFLISAAAVVGIVGASCGDDDADSADTTTATVPVTEPPLVAGDVTVFAAASLTDAFTEIGEAFMTEYPDSTVTFNFAASSELVTQINEGAPADVFASADQNNMTKLTDAGNNGAEPAVFATNSLEIIVGPGNPEGITEVADLANPEIIFITCAPEVPIGAYTAEVFTKAGVTVTPASYEENVRGIVTKVTLGEADAGIVYKTDVTAVGDQAEGVAIPVDLNLVAEYPLVVTKEAPNAEAGQAFVGFVLGEQGLKILASYGFTAP
jgi:molybdate transport system substrate-binding protein